jgi:PAS domain S-box-containing protein
MKKEKKSVKAASSRKTVQPKLNSEVPATPEEYQKLIKDLHHCKTELTRKKQELRQLKETAKKTSSSPGSLYHSFCNSLPSGDFILTRKGIIREVNKLGAKLLNSDSSLLVNKDFTDFVTVETRPALRQFLKEIFAADSGLSCTTILSIVGNPNFFIHARGILSADRKSCNVIICDAFNKQLESALIESQHRYTKFHESIMDGFVFFDMQGNVKESNEIFQLMLDYSSEELSHLTYKDITPVFWHDIEQKILEDEVFENGYSDVYEKEYIRKDGTIFPIELRMVLVKNDAGEKLGMWAFIRDITSRKLRDKQILENEYWLKESQRIGRLGSYTLDLITGKYTSSEVLDSIFGIDQDMEKNIETWKNTVAPEYLKEVMDHFYENVLKKGEPLEIEYQIIRANDNERRWVWSTGLLNRDEEGTPVQVFGIIQDITERKKRNEMLIENEYWLKESQRIGRLGSYSFDIKKDKYTCSEVLDSIFGIEKDSEKTTSAWVNMVVPEQQGEMLEYFLKSVLLEKQHFDREYEIIRATDNERRWVWGLGELSLDDDGNPVTMFGIIQDITDRKQAEEALRRSEIEYRDTLNSLPDWIFVVDEQLHLLTVNKPFREECLRQGLSPENIGKRLTTKIPFISPSTIEAIEHVFLSASGLVLSGKIDLKSKSIYAEIRIIPFLKNQRTDKVITLIRDKSREREIEELKLKNLEQKEVLLREIHHRVKNNLSIVLSLLNFQLRKHTDPLLNRIIQDIQMRIRSMALIHEHLYFSENLDRIPLASYIRSLISYITTSFKEQKVHLETNLDQMDVRIETALPLGLIINELLTNAFKYAFPDFSEGDILVQIQNKEDDLVTLTIRDNGIGLPDTVKMDSEKSLGLFIVRLLVEQLEGTVEIIRQNGTTFIIRFRNLSFN